jgi:Protein of unknown function (DUF3102)
MSEAVRALAAATAQGPRKSVQQDSSNGSEFKATHPATQASIASTRERPIGSRVEFAAEINAAHAEAERSLRASVMHAVLAGELLLKAKRSIGHGHWADWLSENIDFSDRLAQAYMRLARLPAEKRNAVADLPLREALSAIRSREKQLAEERTARKSERAQICTVVEGEVLCGEDAIRAIPPTPPPPPATAEQIADDLIAQLVQVTSEAPRQLSTDDLRAAFDRKFGASDRVEEDIDGWIRLADVSAPEQVAEKLTTMSISKVRRVYRLIGNYLKKAKPEAASTTASNAADPEQSAEERRAKLGAGYDPGPIPDCLRRDRGAA